VLYGAVLSSAAVVGVMGDVSLYGATVAQQWLAQQCAGAQQQWMLPVRSVVRRTVRGSVSVRWTEGCPVARHTIRCGIKRNGVRR
jgi:hypothetical protein